MAAINARRDLVVAEWRRSRQALQAAAVLTRSALHADAISRAYYAILHAAKAGLQTRGISADRHHAANHQFNQHLIHAGHIEREWLEVFRIALRMRIAADYNVTLVFTRADAEHHHRQAQAFCDRISRYLLDAGFAAAELADAPP